MTNPLIFVLISILFEHAAMHATEDIISVHELDLDRSMRLSIACDCRQSLVSSVQSDRSLELGFLHSSERSRSNKNSSFSSANSLTFHFFFRVLVVHRRPGAAHRRHY